MAETEHGERCERAWYRDHGLSATAIVERARWQLEGWAGRPGGLSGGVTLVRLVPEEVRSDDGRQGSSVGWALAGRRGRRPRRGAPHRAGRRAGGHGAGRGRAAGCRPSATGWCRRPRSISTIRPSGSTAARDRGRVATPRRHRRSCPPSRSPIELLAGDGRAVAVTGRGEISAAPVELVVGTSRHRIVAWAGPWPLEQRWWTPERSRRLARMQIVTEGGAAHLVGSGAATLVDPRHVL